MKRNKKLFVRRNQYLVIDMDSFEVKAVNGLKMIGAVHDVGVADSYYKEDTGLVDIVLGAIDQYSANEQIELGGATEKEVGFSEE